MARCLGARPCSLSTRAGAPCARGSNLIMCCAVCATYYSVQGSESTRGRGSLLVERCNNQLFSFSSTLRITKRNQRGVPFNPSLLASVCCLSIVSIEYGRLEDSGCPPVAYHMLRMHCWYNILGFRRTPLLVQNHGIALISCNINGSIIPRAISLFVALLRMKAIT